MKSWLRFTFLLLCSFQSYAQAPKPARSSTLMELARRWAQEENTWRAQARLWSQQNNRPTVLTDSSGRTAYLQRILPSGEPLYRRSDNLQSATTLQTKPLYYGLPGIGSLQGNGLRLGIWDTGPIRISHREFGGRLNRGDNLTATSFSAHSTHVAGTLIAAGLDSPARGMAPAALLTGYDFTNDRAEMALEAANGLLLSNHSYSYLAGWDNTLFANGLGLFWFGWEPYSLTRDYKFGFYDESAQNWDTLALLAPHYLIVKSAGNDRGDSRPAGTLHNVQDSLSPYPYRLTTLYREPDGGTTGYRSLVLNSNAKNILTIGNIYGFDPDTIQPSQIRLYPSSGCGPTSDGRIKPDLVAPGVNVYSASAASDSNYTLLTGTSMSSPASCGSLLLLQELYYRLHNRYLKNASLKALAIHTASEAGSTDGPDYKFGWGVLNTKKAAELLLLDTSSHALFEDSLLNGNTQQYFLHLDSSVNLKATLTWTDVPANVSYLQPIANSNSKLVNDLDIRLIRLSDNSTHFPWVLNPNQPDSAATQGDNINDNTEQISLKNASAGDYILRISHKGTLVGGKQCFGLVLSGASLLDTNFSVELELYPAAACSTDSVWLRARTKGSFQGLRWQFPQATPASDSGQVVGPIRFGASAMAKVLVDRLGRSDTFSFPLIFPTPAINLPYQQAFSAAHVNDSLWSTDTAYNPLWSLTLTNAQHGQSLKAANHLQPNARGSLYSPLFNLSQLHRFQLKFDYAYQLRDSTHRDTLLLKAIPHCGGTAWELNRWILGSQLPATARIPMDSSAFLPSSDSDWCQSAANACFYLLVDTLGFQSNVRLVFECRSGNGNNFYLDNLQLIPLPLQPPSAAFALSDSIVCPGDTVQFTDLSSQQPSQWLWTIPGAIPPSSNQKNPSFQFPNSGWYSVSLHVQNSDGADSVLISNKIRVVARPAISLTAPDSLCKNASAISLSGSPSGGIFSGSGVNNGLFNPAQAGVGSFVITYTLLDSGCTFVDSRPIRVKPSPQTSFSPLPDRCLRELPLVLQGGSPTGGYYSGTGVSGNSFNVQQSGLYLLRYTVNLSGCVDSSASSIHVLPNPPTPSISNPIPGTLQSSLPWGNIWLRNGQATGDTAIVLQPILSGNYQVLGRWQGCPSDTSSAFNYIAASVQALSDPSFSLFPNPSQGWIQLTWKENARPLHIRIIDNWGRVIWEGAPASENPWTLNISPLKSGIYSLEAQSEIGRFVRRFVKLEP